MGIKAFNHGDDFVNKFVKARVSDSTGLDALSPEPSPSGLTATGGVISDYPSGPTIYRAHIFTSSGTFEVSAIGDYPAEVEYLVIGGGGAGGYNAGGGGGAGAFRTNLSGHPLAQSAFPVSTSPGEYTVTIGAGGASGGSSSPNRGSDGVSSVF